MLVFGLFLVFPLFAQEAEKLPEETNSELAIQEEAYSEEPYIGETIPEEPEKKLNWFLRLFEDTRRPIIKTDNLIFGVPEYLNFSFGFDIGYDDVFWIGLGLKLDYTAGPFSFVADIHFLNDQKYPPADVMVPSGSLGAFYFMLREGGLVFDYGPVKFWGGRFRNYDEIDSPYTLFLNSNGISANTLKLRLESNYFIYQTQWIGLNLNSSVSSPAWNEYARRRDKGNWTTPVGYPDPFTPYGPGGIEGLDNGFPDRGVNYKIYALKVKDWRLGFLDASVYSGRYFDAEYLLSPIPMYFTQYFRKTAGRPWATDQNDNCLLGFFWDIKKDNWDAYAQALIDDFSLGFMRWLYHDFSRNPWKAAWALGGQIHTRIGRFGFHHAGALKYTFEPIGTDDEGRFKDDSAATAYGYTYYPETRYFDGTDTLSLVIEDMMVGYKYGENNLAFQVDYQNRFGGFLITSELELVLAGNNSPANPWHDYDSRSSMYEDNISGAKGGYGSQLLNDGQIEKRLEFRVNVTRRFGPMSVYAAMAIGGRFNKLVLKPAEPDTNYTARTVDDDIWIWKASDKHEFIFRFSIGFRYVVPVI